MLSVTGTVDEDTRLDPKRIVPVKSADIMRKKLSQPWALWRIDRLTTSLADLVIRISHQHDTCLLDRELELIAEH